MGRAMNRHKYWKCPYYKWDGISEISCEAGKPMFPDRLSANEYMNEYCAGEWKECTLAKALTNWYEGREQ